MKVRGVTKSFGFYVGDHTRPMVERLVDASGNLSDEIWSIPIDAAAIRDAGVTCSTCKHRRDGEIQHGGIMWCHDRSEHVDKDYFCADHSLLTQPSEGKG